MVFDTMNDLTTRQLAVLLAIPTLATVLALSYLHLSPRHDESEEPTAFSEKSPVDPPLLKDNSTIKSYTTRYATYPSIRTFYREHPHVDQLPSEPEPLPLLVFIHGLGGSLAQFAPLLGSLINIAPCLGIDMPGCGLSKLSPTTWDAYSTEALAQLLKTSVEDHQSRHPNRGVVLIGHSFGCSLSALLASKTAPASSRLDSHVLGLVAICPKSSPPTRTEVKVASKLFLLPNFILDGLRWLDRRGGTESTSVARFVGKDAGIDLKKLQERYNEQFPTPVWKRYALGSLPSYDAAGIAHGGFPGKETWTGLEVPLMLIAGESDTVTKPEEITNIVEYLQISSSATELESTASEPIPTALSLDINPSPSQTTEPTSILANDTNFGTRASTTTTTSRHSAIVKTAILPAPASHALLYDHATYRTLAGLIEDFLSTRVSTHLNLGWQLQTLTTTGKWDVKNLEKWKRVVPVSEPIGPGSHGRRHRSSSKSGSPPSVLFRALKTLREQDPTHTPAIFAREWHGRMYAIIDISRESPIYDPKQLEQGGIHYHKFPTVSKIPPTPHEVEDFIALVERLRKEMAADQSVSDDDDDAATAAREDLAIGMHCHYGYNRTGFFMVCYLIEKEGYGVQEAIDEFARQRPPGIRHDHFIDTLFVRYCVGLKKAPTIK